MANFKTLALMLGTLLFAQPSLANPASLPGTPLLPAENDRDLVLLNTEDQNAILEQQRDEIYEQLKNLNYKNIENFRFNPNSNEIEVDAIDAAGRQVTLYMDAKTGAIVFIQDKS